MYILHPSGADPGFEKGGAQGIRGFVFKISFSQFRGLFKEFGTKRGGRAPPPPLDPRLSIIYIFNLMKIKYPSLHNKALL